MREETDFQCPWWWRGQRCLESDGHTGDHRYPWDEPAPQMTVPLRVLGQVTDLLASTGSDMTVELRGFRFEVTGLAVTISRVPERW